MVSRGGGVSLWGLVVLVGCEVIDYVWLVLRMKIVCCGRVHDWVGYIDGDKDCWVVSTVS